jgi:hypothetical protein
MLAGCNSSWFEEREPWRHEAEVQCLKSGAVKEGTAVVMLRPISGPGVCGADFPLKVAALGESSVLGYADEALRPPGAVPGGYSSARPSIPSSSPGGAYPPNDSAGYPSNLPFSVNPAYPHDTHLPPNQGYEPALPPSAVPRSSPQYPSHDSRGIPPGNGPISLAPPGVEAPSPDAEGSYQMPLPTYGAPRDGSPARGARGSAAPVWRQPSGGEVVPMSPSRGRIAMATTASVTPAATLACPIVSALDRWITESVQPAAQKWFGQPVVEIKQISAYSCRGMNGIPGAKISEHAFGNALDIAAFVLADGHKVTVKDGWRGTPEEQGFLRDVQGAACEQFTTVLAPGSNVYHYNHIHVDLMRRASGRRICEPGAVSGDEIAARARARYAASRRDASITGAIAPNRMARRPAAYSAYGEEDRALPDAIAGDD